MKYQSSKIDQLILNTDPRDDKAYFAQPYMKDVASNCKQRQRIERAIIRTAVRSILGLGYVINVFDGEEVTLKGSKDITEIMGAIMSTDNDNLQVCHSEHLRSIGSVFLVYGNDGPDVISDYHTVLEPMLATANALADEFEQAMRS